MNNYESILSLVSQADQPLEDVLKKQSELGQEADTVAQTIGGVLIHGSTKNIIEHLQERVGKVRDDIVEGVKNKLAEVKDKVMDKITEAKAEGQAKLNEVVSGLKPEGTEDELNPVLSYLRNLQTPHNFSQTDEGNIILNEYTDNDVERGIREVSPELSEDEVQTGVRILNDNQAFTDQFPSSVDDPLSLETQRLLQRQKLGKVGREATERDEVEMGIDANPALRDNKDAIIEGLTDDKSFADLYKLRFPDRRPLTQDEASTLRKQTFERFKTQGQQIKREPETRIEDVEPPTEFQDPAQPPTQFQDPIRPPRQFEDDDEEPLSADDLLPSGSGSVTQDVDLRQLTGQRRIARVDEPTEPTQPSQNVAVNSRLSDPVPQNTSASLQATDELQGGQMTNARELLQNQRDIQQQINNLRVVPEGERPADLPFLQRQTLADLPEPTQAIVPTSTSTAPVPIDAPVEDDISQTAKTALSKVQSETQSVFKSVSSNLEEKAGNIGSKLAELTEESTIGDDTGVGDVLTLGLGLASLFTGGLFHHAPKVVQPVVSQLLNPTFQMGVNE